MDFFVCKMWSCLAGQSILIYWGQYGELIIAFVLPIFWTKVDSLWQIYNVQFMFEILKPKLIQSMFIVNNGISLYKHVIL